MPSPLEEPAARDLDRVLSEARLLALDVDGTLTDGRVVYVGDEELCAFDVQDGQGLVWLRDAGIHLVWITGRGSRAVERRAKELRVDELLMQVKDKTQALADVQARLEIAPAQTLAMGDDLADLGLARRAALFVAPANARDEVKARAAIVTRAAGGAGAVRELVERVLRARGLWEHGDARRGGPGKAE